MRPGVGLLVVLVTGLKYQARPFRGVRRYEALLDHSGTALLVEGLHQADEVIVGEATAHRVVRVRRYAFKERLVSSEFAAKFLAAS